MGKGWTKQKRHLAAIKAWKTRNKGGKKITKKGKKSGRSAAAKKAWATRRKK
jgi:hypothetical protein